MFIQCEIATFRQFSQLSNSAVPWENVTLPFSGPWLLAVPPRSLLGWHKLCAVEWGTRPRNRPATGLLSALGYSPGRFQTLVPTEQREGAAGAEGSRMAGFSSSTCSKQPSDNIPSLSAPVLSGSFSIATVAH